jgi:hypothetical protein
VTGVGDAAYFWHPGTDLRADRTDDDYRIALRGRVIAPLDTQPVIMGHSFGGPSCSSSLMRASAPPMYPSTAPP